MLQRATNPLSRGRQAKHQNLHPLAPIWHCWHASGIGAAAARSHLADSSLSTRRCVSLTSATSGTLVSGTIVCVPLTSTGGIKGSKPSRRGRGLHICPASYLQTWPHSTIGHCLIILNLRDPEEDRVKSFCLPERSSCGNRLTLGARKKARRPMDSILYSTTTGSSLLSLSTVCVDSGVACRDGRVFFVSDARMHARWPAPPAATAPMHAPPLLHVHTQSYAYLGE